MKKHIKKIIDILIIISFIYILYLGIPAYTSYKQTAELQDQSMAIVDAKYSNNSTCENGYIYEEITHDLADVNLEANDVIGYVAMPEYEMKVPILQGSITDDQYQAMSRGVSHDPSSALPTFKYDNKSYYGETIVLAGHRNLSFNSLKDASVGDGVILNIDGNTYLYEVTKAMPFQPDDTNAVFYTSDQETLVMYTCYPFIIYGPITGRYGVYATRVDKLPC